MSTSTSTRTTAVLIVDDHAGYRAIANEVVEAARGFVAGGSAADRLEALRLVGGGGVDLVLMDVNLGDDDGLSLTAELCSIAEAQQVSIDVVLVTAVALDDLPRSARTCGARGHLPKAELSPSALGALVAGVYDWPDGNATGRAGR